MPCLHPGKAGGDGGAWHGPLLREGWHWRGRQAAEGWVEVWVEVWVKVGEGSKKENHENAIEGI